MTASEAPDPASRERMERAGRLAIACILALEPERNPKLGKRGAAFFVEALVHADVFIGTDPDRACEAVSQLADCAAAVAAFALRARAGERLSDFIGRQGPPPKTRHPLN